MNKEQRIRKAIAREKSRLHLSTIVVLLIVVAGCFYYAYYYFQASNTQEPVSQETVDVEKIMSEFIQENLKEEYQFSSLEPQAIMNAFGQTIYTARWTHESYYFSIQYNDTGKQDLVIRIALSPKMENLESEVTLAFVNSFFKPEADKLDCSESSIAKACEKVWFEGGKKMNIGIVSVFSEDYSLIYIAKLPPDSKTIGEYL